MTTPVPTPEDVAATALDEADAPLADAHGHEHPAPSPGPTAADLPPGVYVQPGEIGYLLNTQAMPDGRVWTVLRIEHAAGSTVLPLPPEFARTFGLGLLDEAARGLSVMQTIAADRAAAAEAPQGPRLLGPDGQPVAQPTVSLVADGGAVSDTSGQ